MKINFNSISVKLILIFSALALVLIFIAVLTYINDGSDANLRRATGLMVILGLFLLVSFSYFLHKNITNAVYKVKEQVSILSEGNLPETITSKNELQDILEEINVLTKNLRNVKNFAQEVGSGNFDSNIQVFNNKGAIGESLAEMRESLKHVAEQGRERNWINDGMSMLNETLRKNAHDIDLLADDIIINLVKYVKANQGGLFIYEEEEKSLLLKGCYAYGRKKYINKELKPGEGLAGQCFLERESIFMTEVPENYVNITSGLGNASPRCIFIVPIKYNEDVLGIIELASFNKFTKVERDFIEKISDSIGASISSVKTTFTTSRLLKDAQELTGQLKFQEDEMKQNLEELHATQEEMSRMSEELNLRLQVLENSLPTFEIDLKGHIIEANNKTSDLLGYSVESLKRLNLENLVQENQTLQQIRSTLSAYDSLETSVKIRKNTGDTVDLKALFNPMPNHQGDIKSFIVIVYQIEKEEITKPSEFIFSQDESELVVQLTHGNQLLKSKLKEEIAQL